MISLNNVRIIFRNFSGVRTQYNREGDRNFAVVLSDMPEEAQHLLDEGWNVKINPAREEGEKDFIFMSVKVNYRGYSKPRIYVERVGMDVEPLKITEENIDMLDDIDIESVDVDIIPYDWTVNGRSGIAAYLKGMYVRQNVDRFEKRYNEKIEALNPVADDADLPF